MNALVSKKQKIRIRKYPFEIFFGIAIGEGILQEDTPKVLKKGRRFFLKYSKEFPVLVPYLGVGDAEPRIFLQRTKQIQLSLSFVILKHLEL